MSNAQVQITGQRELYGTTIKDWIIYCPDVGPVDFRVYGVLRSLAPEKWGSKRELSLAELCALTPGKGGKPMAIGGMRDVLRRLTRTGLVTTPEGQPLTTSSRKPNALLRIQVNHMPPAGYSGPLSAKDALDAAKAGCASNQKTETGCAANPTGCAANPTGCAANPTGCAANPHTASDLGECDPPFSSSFSSPSSSSLSSGPCVTVPSVVAEVVTEEREEEPEDDRHTASGSASAVPDGGQQAPPMPSGDSARATANPVQAVVAAFADARPDAVLTTVTRARIASGARALLGQGFAVERVCVLAADMATKGKGRWADLEQHAERNGQLLAVPAPRRVREGRCPRHPEFAEGDCVFCDQPQTRRSDIRSKIRAGQAS